MDFELLSEKPRKPSLIEDFERLLVNRKWSWARWTQKPPQGLALIILVAVALELTVSSRLLSGNGVSFSLMGGFGGTLLIVTLIELGMALIATQAAEIFGSKGRSGHVLTFFNLSLTPLLLVLPVTVVTYISGRLAVIRLMLYFLLVVKVLSNWREAIELVYKFTKMQSAIVMYVASGIACVTLVAMAYITLINRVVSALF
jgi:hypothetical protein